MDLQGFTAVRADRGTKACGKNKGGGLIYVSCTTVGVTPAMSPWRWFCVALIWSCWLLACGYRRCAWMRKTADSHGVTPASFISPERTSTTVCTQHSPRPWRPHAVAVTIETVSTVYSYTIYRGSSVTWSPSVFTFLREQMRPLLVKGYTA